MQSMYLNTHPPNQNTTLFLFTNCTIEFFDHKNVKFCVKVNSFYHKNISNSYCQCINVLLYLTNAYSLCIGIELGVTLSLSGVL